MPMVHDPFGLEPLYAHRRTARTSRNLHDLIGAAPSLNERALLEHTLYGDVWEETATLFADVQRVPSIRLTPSLTLVDRPGHELVDLFWRTLVDATQRAIPGDSDNIVVAISGGLDATALAAALVELFGTQRVRAMTVGSPNDEETEAARLSVAALGIELEVVAPDERTVDWPQHELWPALPRTATERAWDERTDDALVVWGIGGDSLLRGDRQHYLERLRQRRVARAFGDITRSVLLHGCKPALGLRAALATPSKPASPPRWLDREHHAAASAIANRRAAQASFRRGVDEMFSPSWSAFFEWMAPWHNDPPTEHRFPYFDTGLVELMASVPTAPWCVDKNILRAALRGRIPDAVRLRKKSPAVGPAEITLDASFADDVNEWLAGCEYTSATVVRGTHLRRDVEGVLRCAATERWKQAKAKAAEAEGSGELQHR